MNRIGVRIAAVLTVGLLFGATACGGGSSDESSSNGDAVTAEKTGGDSSSSGSDSGSDPSNIDDLGDAVDALGGDCLEAAAAYASIGLSILTYMGGATPEQIEELQSQVDDLEQEIPSEIQDDFQVFADGVAQYAAAMEGFDMSNILDPEVQDRLEEAGSALDSPEMTEAQANIDAYFAENCS